MRSPRRRATSWMSSKSNDGEACRGEAMLRGVARGVGLAIGASGAGRFGGIGAVGGEPFFGDGLFGFRAWFGRIGFGRENVLSPSHIAVEKARVRNWGLQTIGNRVVIFKKAVNGE